MHNIFKIIIPLINQYWGLVLLNTDENIVIALYSPIELLL